jgi:hypothetical protein
MTNRKLAVALVAMAALGLSGAAQAQSGNGGDGFGKRDRRGEQRVAPRGFDHRVDRRQAKQRARIRDGRQDGELTRKEAGRLKREQRHVNRLENRFGSDGRYSPRERRILEKKQDRASRHIKRAKNNDRTRYGNGGGRDGYGKRDRRHGYDNRSGRNGYGKHDDRRTRGHDKGWARAGHRGRGPENGYRHSRHGGDRSYAGRRR